MDHKKKKKKSHSPFDVWPPPRKEKLTEGEEREELMKPKNRSYVDLFEELQSDLNAPVFEGEEEEPKEEEQYDQEDKDEKDEKDSNR
ncbi:hypothetical protein C4565_01365 [Candidatus Parcubacteria bacterium]|nr:MAG: hypothetical protein C4565_01365 [Candidatus Parcubacteria bacterium]